MFTVAAGATISTRLDAESTNVKTDVIIEANFHAGKGTGMSAPWSTFADPKVTLRRVIEAGIINNSTFE